MITDKSKQVEILPIIFYSNIYQQNIISYKDFIFREKLYNNKLWDEDICKYLEYYFIDGTDILDIGAHIGLSTLGFKHYNKTKKVNKIHCFECEISNLNCLKYNLKNFDDVMIYGVGLSDSFSMGNIAINNYNRGCNSIIKIKDNKNDNFINFHYKHFDIFKENFSLNDNILIPLIALDDIQNFFQNRVSVIKIDIEGFECMFLKGAKKFLEKHRPVIIIELFEEIFDEAIEILKDYDYKMLKKIEIDYSNNYIFIP